MTTAIIVLALLILFFIFRSKSTSPEVYAELPGPGNYDFDIVGESNYQAALEKICGGKKEDSAEHYTEAVLYLEDSNPYDNKAVRVDIEGETVGYLSRSNARSYRKQLKGLGQPEAICRCEAVIVGGWRRSKKDQGSFGVKLDLP